jgi:crossover junction endodeoxyribonuclease RuvC
MVIMGIDPGTARVGWAVVNTDKGITKALSYGCITTDKNETAPKRLEKIYLELSRYVAKFKPDCMAIEDLFFTVNAKTAIPVGQARGVILLTAAQKNINVVSYTPLTVKQTICGSGRAEKQQVQKMVTRLLHLPQIPKPDDVADALAIALTHAYSYKMKGKTL